MIAKRTHRPAILLPLACALALVPYSLMAATWPGDVSLEQTARIVREHIAPADSSQKAILQVVIDQYGPSMAKAARPYMDLILWKHQAVGAMASLSLFAVFVTYLLWRTLEMSRPLRSLAVLGVTGFGFLAYLTLLRSTEPLVDFVKAALATPCPYLWPFPLSALSLRYPALEVLVSCGGLAAVSLLSLTFLVWRRHGGGDAPVETPRRMAIKVLISAGVVCSFLAAWHQPNPDLGQPDGSWARHDEDRLSAMRTMRENLILGTGAGNYKIVHPLYASDWENRLLGKEVAVRSVMSDFLHTAVETGPFGLLGLIWIVVLGLRSLPWVVLDPSSHLFQRAVSLPLAWSLGGLALGMHMGIPLQAPASGLIGWILLGVAFSLPRLRQSSRSSGVDPDEEGAPTDEGVSRWEAEGGSTGSHRSACSQDRSDQTCSRGPE